MYEENNGMSAVQNSGYIDNKTKIEMMMQAGKRLIQHRINSQLIDVSTENIERSIFGLQRYYDKLDICELLKSQKDKIDGIMSTYSLRKQAEAAEKAKEDTKQAYLQKQAEEEARIDAAVARQLGKGANKGSPLSMPDTDA